MATIAPATPPVPALKDMSEDQLAQTIRDKHSRMISSFRTSVEAAIEIGELLIEAKKRCGHGNFEGWIKDHCGFSYRSARRYANMARDKDKILAQLKSSTAQEVLGDLSATRLLPSPTSAASTPEPVAATDKYDKAEEKLIEWLQELPVAQADEAIGATISKLKSTVATMRKGATNKAA